MRLKSVLTTIFVALMLVVGIDYASFAATGHSMILGKINKANAVTTLKRTTAGPALSLHTTTTSSAPMVVNGRGKVANLNADLLDGRDSTSFATKNAVRIYRYPIASGAAAGNHTFQVPGTVPAGQWMATYNVPMTGITGSAGSPVTVYCEFSQDTATGFHDSGFSSSVITSSTIAGVSGTTVVDTANGNSLQLLCFASSGTWSTPAAGSIFGITFDAMPAEITLTRIESSTQGTGTVSRIAPSSARVAANH